MNCSPPLSPLLTDLYELTMAAAYFDRQMSETASFSLYSRPNRRRGDYIAAGLGPVLDLLASFRFVSDEIDYLNDTHLFKDAFLDYLTNLRFSGDVWAMPEGSVFFPDEPILEITAPLIQAQILETVLINTMGLHTLIATKAARCVDAAQGRTLIDFGLRRTQGPSAGMAVARSTYLAGFDATSNVLAGKCYGIPISGTMAHSFVQAFESESEAFYAYVASFPKRSVLLIDTFDTIKGAQMAVMVARRMKMSGNALLGVRLDSGDLVAMSKQVRRIFDKADLKELKIFASGGLDEYRVADAVARGAAIDVFGVGTKVGVSVDAPYLDMVYKMVQYENRYVNKLSPGKQTLAGPKQVYRHFTDQGYYDFDTIALRAEKIAGASALLSQVMERGRRLEPDPDLDGIRHFFQDGFNRLPAKFRTLDDFVRYPVKVSRNLQNIQPDQTEGALYEQHLI